MKLESLVIVDQHATVNMYLGLVHTAHHVLGVEHTRSSNELFIVFFTLPCKWLEFYDN